MEFGSKINRVLSKPEIDLWLAQFDAADRWAAERLLQHFRYYDVAGVVQALTILHERIEEAHEAGRPQIYVPCGEVASSASLVTYLFRQANRLQRSEFVALEHLTSMPLAGKRVVILDDFSGSGHSAVRLWEDSIAPLCAEYPTCEFVFACMVAHQDAAILLTTKTRFKLAVAELIPSSELPFAPDSAVFPSSEERTRAESVIKTYTPEITGSGILGYGDTQSLVAFFFNTPDNTLPLFWSANESWRPLLRYGADLATFKTEVVAGRGHARSHTIETATAIQGLDVLDAQEISSEQAIVILEEFPYKALHLLGPAVVALNIEAATLRRMISVTRKLRHDIHEQRAVCTALFIVPTDARDALISRCFASPTLSTADASSVQGLAELVDGVGGAVVVTASGEVLGCVTYNAELLPCIMPIRLGRAAGECRALRAIAFVFVGSGRATLMVGGERFLTYRKSTWHIPQPRILATLDAIEHGSALSPGVLREVYQLAVEMSDVGEGAIMMVGDEQNVLSLCDGSRESFAWNRIIFSKTNWAAIRPLAKQDGATVVSASGHVIDGKRILRPSASIDATVPLGAGARHSSAAKMTGATAAVAVVVSSDGAITLFRSGRIIFSDMT